MIRYGLTVKYRYRHFLHCPFAKLLRVQHKGKDVDLVIALTQNISGKKLETLLTNMHADSQSDGITGYIITWTDYTITQ